MPNGPCRFCQFRRAFGHFFVPESLTEGNQGSDSLELVDDVDEAIANIAVIFHWPPSTYDDMDIVELSKWHRRALKRNQIN
ncbi:GpE family phage tail protein [Acinetobacter sp. WU_MDCI_Abxc22]|uniref:GpE family phage tail protein n=1 Tax=Acinetobacter sp. WU_MDCI_Abxc22 TaxID=2850071 RepID=UPI003976836D|nr:GpE family phage tail protein [Acinetobacter sp. WU_MDCI_Abxc22]